MTITTDKSNKTDGIHHLGLTVPDLNATRDFFIDALDFKQVGEKPSYPAAFVSDGSILITLWQVEDESKATPFDRKSNIGLHHFALKVNDIANLAIQLESRDDVEIEFKPEALGESGIQHMMCRISGNIRLEFIAL
ncbi:MAG: catechol 2,3-dioxygenase-like lactoylglutathione lyase family enzyme [Parasphingorhabdus sp.]|jgi:catechol 2,3-dioxygenase-like lactoylglutathione lyase family enzyme